MIYKWIKDELLKYSFVTKTEIKNAYLYVHYELNRVGGWKRISIRANKSQLISFIEKIKEEIGFYEDKEKRIQEGQYDVDTKKPLMFIRG